MKSTAKNLLIAFLITFFPVVLLFAPLFINYNKSASNTKILGKNYSHLSRSEIINKLNQDFVLPETLKLTYQSKFFDISTASISAKIDTDKIASTILYRRLDEGLFNYVKNFFNPKEFSLILSYNSPSLTQNIEDIASQIDKPFIPTELVLKDKKISTNSGSIGLSVDQNKLQEQILNNLSYGNFSENISIPVNSIGTIPNENQINQTISRAQKLIGKSIILITPSDRVVINDQTLISWIDFDNGFQKDKISSYSQNTSQSFKHDPIDAVFKFEDKKVLEFQNAKNGIAVDPKQLTQDIVSAFTNLEN
jgi:hypothetical protein